MGRTEQRVNPNATMAAENDLDIGAILARRLAPVIDDWFPEPIRLTKRAEKGDDILYAIGRGPAGLVVQYQGPSGVTPPRSFVSFATHQPYVFESIDIETLESLGIKPA